VRLVISDQHAGLVTAPRRVFPGVGHALRAISGPLSTAKVGRLRCLPDRPASLETPWTHRDRDLPGGVVITRGNWECIWTVIMIVAAHDSTRIKA
jgi:hypothetical protein